MPSVNWITGEITVPISDLQLIEAGPPAIYQHDTEAFRLALKDLEDDPDGRPWPDTHTHNLPYTISGITYAQSINIIPPYFVTYEAGAYRVSLTGSNNNIADVATINGVGIIANNSAGQTFSEQINDQSFINAAVYLDVANGLSGTQFPRGTPTDPVNNLSDALSIANSRGLSRIYVDGFITANASENLDGIELIGGSGSQNVVLLSGASTDQAAFERIIVAGAVDGLARFVDCILGGTGLGGITGLQGRVKDSIINNAAGVIQDTAGSGTLFDNCHFVAPNDPQIVLNANGVGFGLRQCTGNILITNQTDPEQLQVHIEGARVELAASCTAGTLIFEGHGMVTDNSAGTTVDDSGLIANSIWGSIVEGARTARGVMRVMLAALTGKTTGIGTASETYRDEADGKPRISVDFDANGNRIDVTLDDT